MQETTIWGIHTLDDYMFLTRNMIAIGWKEMGDLSSISPERDAFKQKYQTVYPNSKPQAIANCAGMLYRFVYEAKNGDYVIFPSKPDRQINIGVIEGEYKYSPDELRYVQTRKVKWLKHLPRTMFSQGALYEIGSAMSFFTIKNYAEEFMAALNNNLKKPEIVIDEDDVIAKTSADIVESTKDFILKELSKNLKGYDLENFISDLLQAMGYRTKVSAHGGDSGIDIIAYKDELPPRILVQVKSGSDYIKETTIQSLKGAMREGDYGLFVTLTDYTKNAKKYLENTPIIRGINGYELADLILKNYNNMSDKYKKIIPLEAVFIPVANEDN